MREHTTTLTRPVDANKHARWLDWAWLVLRVLGAFAVIVGGAIHLHEYRTTYGSIGTIGPLFMVDFIASLAIGLALVSPLEHIFRSAMVAALVVLAGIGLAGGAFVMLLISEHGELFGFHEAGFSPTSITATKYVEVAAVVLLGLALVARFAPRSTQRRW
jgi:hypothetical protein